jgi:hypothetical protein
MASVPTAPSTTPGPFPEDLLSELLAAFRVDEAPNRYLFGQPPEALVRRAALGLPSDRAERTEIYRREVEEAAPILRDLVEQARALARYPLRRPEEYRRGWAEIVEAWNGAIYERRWAMLPPLCESCGRPVLLRQPERAGGANLDPSTVCSDECRQRRKAVRRQRVKRKRATKKKTGRAAG